jgi:ABC-2 type transport system permease protein
MPADLWVITGLCVWIGSLLFAAFGLFVGYLPPSENVTQVIALALMLCSSPEACSSRLATSRRTCRPRQVHAALAGGTLEWDWSLNLAVWLAIFVTGAAWRLHRDTARV